MVTKAQQTQERILKKWEQMMEEIIKITKELTTAKLREYRLLQKDNLLTIRSSDEQEKFAQRTRAITKISKLDNVTKIQSLHLTETHIKLRHRLNVDLEKEHATQVRRNIVLRDTSLRFNAALGFITKSMTGGFGFTAALDKMAKGTAHTVKRFQDLETTAAALRDAYVDQKNAQVAYAELASVGGNVGEASAVLDDANKQVKRAKGERSEAEQSGGIAGNARLEPLFKKLGKMGSMFSKASLPIMLGVGAAGVFMSVIVKALSASPLFQQMMKLMKFAITLILMPIGTFFGAILRPILIMLLRKFIVPMFSTWMPRLMKWGTQIGNWITGGASIFGGGDDSNTTQEEYQDMSVVDKFLAAVKTVMTGGFIKEAGATEDGSYENYGSGDPSDPNGQGTVLSDGSILLNGQIYTKNDSDLVADGEEISISNVDGTNAQSTPNIDPDAFAQMGYQDVNTAPVEETAMVKLIKKMMYNSDLIELERKMAQQIEDWNNKTGQYSDTIEAATMGMKSVVETYVKLESKLINAGMSTEEELDLAKGKGTNISGEVDYDAYLANKSSSNTNITNPYTNYANPDFGLAEGGIINEPISGIGMRTGKSYSFGESGSEIVTPMGKGGGTSIVINIANMSGDNRDISKLRQTILDVIQESNTYRGRV